MFIPLGLVITALLAGTALLALECFMPGIGVAGVSGALLCVFGVVALVPYIGWNVIFVIIAIIILILLCMYVFARSAETGKNPLVLSSRTDKESGFSANEDNSILLGKCGEAVTQLRPAGIALIEGKRVDVVTDGGFVEAGEKVLVTDIHGRRIIVKKI